MRWVVDVACTWIRQTHTEFWWEKLNARDHFEYLGVEGDNIKINLKICVGRVRTGFTWS
jgi:hypothetical protein